MASVGASTPWLMRVIPALATLRTYSVKDARSDLVAGATVATVAVPQAIAYAMVAGVPPEHGLYTAIVMTAVGAVLDSSRQLINGPTNAISIAILSALALVPPERHLEAAILMALLIGAFQLVISLLRLGDLSRYISHSVIIGFTVGASALLVLDQLKNLFGFTAKGDPHDHFILRFAETMMHGGPVHMMTLQVGAATIALLLALRGLKRLIGTPLLPDLLLTVLIMAGVTSHYGLDAHGVRIVGEIPARLPSFALPAVDWVLVRELSTSALAIGLLGLLEAISMAKAIAQQTKQKLDMNQQCFAEACANLSASMFQAIPGSGSLTRSAINQQAGGSTQWAGVVSAVCVAGIVVAFGPLARTIPKATLAGILIVASYRMVDWKGLAFHVRTTRMDAIIVAATALSAVLVSIEFCVIIGVVMSMLLAVQRAGRMLFTEFIVASDGVIHDRHPGEATDPKMLMFGLEGELFFGSATDLEEHLEAIEARLNGEVSVVVLRAKRVRNPDAVSVHMLGEFVERCRHRGVRVLLCGVRAELAEAVGRARLTDALAPLFLEGTTRNSSTLAAVRYAHELIDGDLGAPPSTRPPLVAVAG